MEWFGSERGAFMGSALSDSKCKKRESLHNNYLESSNQPGARGGGVSIINQSRTEFSQGLWRPHR